MEDLFNEEIEMNFEESFQLEKKPKKKYKKKKDIENLKLYEFPKDLFLKEKVINLNEKYYLKCINVLKTLTLTQNLKTYKALTDCKVDGSLEEGYEFLLIDSFAVDMKLLEEQSMQNVKWIFIISYPIPIYKNKVWGGLENYKAVFNLPLGISFPGEKHNIYIYAFLKK